LKRSYLLALVISLILGITVAERLLITSKEIIPNLSTILNTSLHNRKIDVYNYMGYEFINQLTVNTTNKQMIPLILYPNYGLGVQSLLAGYRNKTNRSIIIGHDLDKALPDEYGEKFYCSNSVRKLNDGFQNFKNCTFNDFFTVTGLKFTDKISNDAKISVKIFSNENLLASFNVNENNLLHTPKISSIKIPLGVNGLFGAYQMSDTVNGNISVIVQSNKQQEYFLTGFVKNSEPSYNTGMFHIIDWFNKDGRTFLAINRSVYDNNESIKGSDTCQIINEMLSGSKKFLYFKNQDVCYD
jgi:hypothetical protein